MNLGERIYKLRTEKNLSQGDLAELLDVSRQSISKWENNSATPDLEKIVKLSELFGVSLDELVKGEKVQTAAREGAAEAPGQSASRDSAKQANGATSEQTTGTIIQQAPQPTNPGFPPRKIAGTILLCMGFLVALVFLVMNAFLAGLIFAIPFLICGIICFVCKEHAGLWCSWAVYICVDIYLRLATGITPGIIKYTGYWTAEMNYARLAAGWGIFLVLAGLIGITVWRLRKKPIAIDRSGRNKLILLWAMWLLIGVFIWGLSYLWRYFLTYILSTATVYILVNAVTSWCRTILFTMALTNTARFFRCRRMKQQEGTK